MEENQRCIYKVLLSIISQYKKRKEQNKMKTLNYISQQTLVNK